jgi:hypothetical protein
LASRQNQPWPLSWLSPPYRRPAQQAGDLSSGTSARLGQLK